ncbi:MAG TPA: hypothetical protein VG754_03705 [Verrucomicrobiae bacterium]|nr:hypothetical protein [Verrucomicrobiae bacterium]
MKKALILNLFIALGALSSMAQGVVNANNVGSGVSIYIQDTTGGIDGGAAVMIGIPAATAGFNGAGPGQVSFSLYAAPLGTSLASLEATTPIWTGANPNSTAPSAQGAVVPGSEFILPSPFDGSAPVEFIFQGTATINGTTVYDGWSSEGVVTPYPASKDDPAPTIWGTGIGQISSMVLTPASAPEVSSTLVLSSLSAIGIFLFQSRRKMIRD